MKKYLYILGILIILILLGVLGYVFFNSQESDTGSFADLNLEDTTEDSTFAPDATVTIPEGNTERDPLLQLTTRPVVGYQLISSTSSQKVLFVEDGTGHIFEVALDSLAERRVSNLTIPDVTEAVIARDGNYAVLLSDDIHVVNLQNQDQEKASFVIEENAVTAHIVEDTLLYQVTSQTGTQVRTFSLGATTETGTLFEIPFREAIVGWGQAVAGPHIYYPKPATQLPGYIYAYDDGETSRLPLSGFGATASIHGDDIIFSVGRGDGRIGGYNILTKKLFSTTIKTSPHKCVKASFSVFFCAEPEEYSNSVAKDRRFGLVATSDQYRIISISDETSTNTITTVSRPNSFSESEVALDVESPIFNSGVLLFTDKRSGYLWAYTTS